MSWRSSVIAPGSLILALAASADIIHVDVDGGGDYLTIQEGVDAAAEGDTVLVAPGTYSGPGNCEVSFHDVNLILLSSAGAESTIIDCDGGGPTAIRLNAGEDTTSVICGFTVTNADICVAALSSSPMIVDCVMMYPGVAGVRCEFSGAIIKNTEFHGTTWDDIHDDGVSCVGEPGPTLNHCVFDSCEEGLDARSCSPVVRHCDFLRCGSTCCGAGAYCNGSSPLFEDCWFCECEKTSPWGGAGTVMRLDGCDSVLRRVRFDRNGWGMTNFEVLYAIEGTLLLDKVTFWDNPVSHSAVQAHYAECTIAGCTFVDNWGDAVHVSGWEGSGTIDSTIIAYNGGTAMVWDGADITTWHSCVFGNSDGDTLPGSHFENLFTWPLFCDHEDGDLTLRDDSPCLPANNPWGVLMGAYGAGDCGTGIGGDALAAGDVRIVRLHPNPATNEGSTICLTGAPVRSVDLSIYDLAGRRVRTITTTLSGRGRTECLWDLCDDAGKRFPSGVYFVQVSSARGVGDRAKLVVIR